MRTQWIRVNGQLGGFDAPNFTLTYRIEGDTLQIGLGWEGEFTTELEPVTFTRQ